jgi:cell division protein FtsL
VQNHEQNNFGYRRGFVLGLTLAEAALLLLFVILLLLVVGFERRDRQIAQLSGAEAYLAQIIGSLDMSTAQLQESVEKLTELRKIAEAAGHEWDDDFLELVRDVASVSSLSQADNLLSSLADKERDLQALVDQLSEVSSETDILELVDKIEEQDDTIRNQRGQLVDLQNRYARQGSSAIMPSCWTTPEGTIDYIFDVVLSSDGILVVEVAPASREQERQRLPMGVGLDTEVYSMAQFRTVTRQLFNWSVQNECRFYVTVYDLTEAHEKDLYKDLLATVEGHFYKRLTGNAPPIR